MKPILSFALGALCAWLSFAAISRAESDDSAVSNKPTPCPEGVARCQAALGFMRAIPYGYDAKNNMWRWIKVDAKGDVICAVKP